MISLADYLLDRSLSDAERRAYLAALSFRDLDRVARDLQLLAGEPPLTFDFLDIGEDLLRAVSQSPDPEAALNNFERFASAFGGKRALYHYLIQDPRATHVLAQLFGFSQFLSEILVRNPEYFDMVTDLEALSSVRSSEYMRQDLERTLAILQTRDSRLNAMRRFKRREMLRTGLRDMLRIADLPLIVGETTHLAEVLVDAAFRLAARTVEGIPLDERASDSDCPALAVFALGKMGGQELNYSSDIDLLFVAGSGDDRRLVRVAEQTIQNLTQSTAEGYLYRVDMRLRPQGSAGAIAPSLDYCLGYYESWAEPWEWQALIKARQVAGDEALGQRFLSFVQDLVFAKQADTSTLMEIQHLKRRTEMRRSQSVESGLNVKQGRGGIRDVEFTVQLLQLLWGTDHPPVRAGNTLVALEALQQAGKVGSAEAGVLREAYCFLRRTENYLQIADEFPLQTLPGEPERLNQLARRMGYAGSDPGHRLLEDLRGLSSAVRDLHERYFYPEGTEEAGEESLRLESLLTEDLTDDLVTEVLSPYGFEDCRRAARNLRLMALGPAHVHVPLRARRLFLQIAPAIMKAAAASPDPDSALNYLESLSSVIGNRSSFLLSLSRNPQTVEVLAALGAVGGPLMQTLLTHPELFDMLMEPEIMTVEKSLSVMLEELRDRLRVDSDPASRLDALRRYRHREMLRIGVRDLSGVADVLSVQRGIAALAEACLRVAYELKVEEAGLPGSSGSLPYSRLAVIGMGKLGGRELHYASDLDVVFVYDPKESGESRPARVESFCEQLLKVLSQPTAEGSAFRTDTRLRPEGGSGAMARTLAGYEEYWQEWMQSWERLALLRARPVAGDEALGDTFMDRSQHWNYSRPVDARTVEELRHIKDRMEKERSESSKDHYDVKLGPGGLNDIEFTAQGLQLSHGAAIPDLRTPNTLDSIHRLHDFHLLSSSDHEALEAAYRFLCRIESRLRISDPGTPSLLPVAGKKLSIVAKSLGYRADTASEGENLLVEYREHTARVREILEERFFGAR